MISHPATESDLRAVARLVAEIHGAADSGAALLDRLGGPATAFAARPFRSGSVRGEWVATPGSSGDGVLLYLHSRRFQFDEPAGVYAARLAAATGFPVLSLDASQVLLSRVAAFTRLRCTTTRPTRPRPSSPPTWPARRSTS